jgi:class 3 adenylate cyclase
MFYTAAAQRSTFVRLDPRGMGLSDRGADFTVDGMVLDIEAVVQRLGIKRLRVIAVAFSSIPALVFTSRHPELVTHLVLSPPVLSGVDLSNERFEAITNLAKVDYQLATESAVRTVMPEFEGQLGIEMAAIMRAGLNEGDFERFVEATREWNAEDEARGLTVPTLLLHSRDNPNFDMARTRYNAGLIENSKLVFIDSVFQVSAAAERFFNDEDTTQSERPPESKPQTPTGGLATILLTDMEGSTTLADQLGDAAAQDVRRAHNDIVRAALAANGGSEIKHTGDGIMASFATASSALDGAIAIQRGVASHRQEHADSPLAVYVGLNAGEPIAEDNDLFGTSINLAARICDHAKAGQILASNVVRELAAGKQFLFADLGETELRGFEDPVKLWELRWEES